MAGNLDFDASSVEPQGSFDPIESGKYQVKIRNTEKRETKNKNGFLLQLELEVQGPTHKGRILFDRLNLWNSNQTAVEIAQKTLSAICHAVGIMQIKNHEELRGKVLDAKVAIKPAEGSYEASNEIKGYSAVSGTTETAPAVTTATTSTDTATPPWARK